MRKQTSATRRIHALLDMGFSTKAIITKMKCTPQAVYNARYQLNRKRGLGAIVAAPVPTPTTGIGTPPKSKPKRKYTRRKQETGIVAAPVKAEGTPVYQITMVEPTLWQRVKGWFA
jgi:hypothetical protein